MDLHERIAEALGWTVKEAQSFSFHTLREMVRPVRPDLAKEITDLIASGEYIIGEPYRPRRRFR